MADGLPAAFAQVPALARGADGRIRLWTAGAARLYGWSAAEALGQHAAALLDTTPSDLPETIAARLSAEGA
ncbi:MAG: PAS domain-containing protein, partial [Acetobacteraceae bacterium]